MGTFKYAVTADHELSKKDYRQAHDRLRVRLLELQRQLKKSSFPVLIVVAGVDGAGKGMTVHQLNEWMDPRFIRTFNFMADDDPARTGPDYQKFWQALPRKGQMGVYSGSWYSTPISHRVSQQSSDAQWLADLKAINRFEQQLIDEGALIIKIWLHLDKEDQLKRIEKLMASSDTAWRVSERDLRHLQVYDRFRPVAAETIESTQKAAPWEVIYGKDHHYREIAVAELVADRLQQRLAQSLPKKSHQLVQPRLDIRELATATIDCPDTTVLDQLDLGLSLDKEEYHQALAQAQSRLNALSRQVSQLGLSVVLVFEGWDAAGKGGVIRRLVAAMDARYYRIIPVAAPSQEELSYPYLWRFWRHLPVAGNTTIFDRSWYGRVLVERVEGLASVDEWQRAYEEIRDFEQQLTDSGILLCKYWLHITPEEQWQRFQQREQVPYKHFKIGDEDYRNRARWCDYAQAVDEMVKRTSSVAAPWLLVPANSKAYARVRVIDDLCQRLARAIQEKG